MTLEIPSGTLIAYDLAFVYVFILSNGIFGKRITGPGENGRNRERLSEQLFAV